MDAVASSDFALATLYYKESKTAKWFALYVRSFFESFKDALLTLLVGMRRGEIFFLVSSGSHIQSISMCVYFYCFSASKFISV